MKWSVVLVAIAKDEAPYIIDWVTYYLSLGVEHFFIYDNDSSDLTARTLEKFVCAGLVTLINWPVRSGQIDAYNHALKLLRHNADWVGFFDIDELIVLQEQSDIPSFLGDLDADQVLIPWKNFPYGGHLNKPGGSDMENYFWCYKTTPETIVQVKHLVRPSLAKHVTAHFSSMTEGRTVVADGTTSAPRHAIAGPTYRGAQINHYATRSLGENTDRLKKGQVSGRSEKIIADFHKLTEQASAALDYDDSILKHFNKFAAERQIWEGRSARPHRFGLGQKVRALYSANPLYYFFLKSYGNFLGGLSEINHVTKTPLISTNSAGKEIELSKIWNDLTSHSVYFNVGAASFQKHFVGSIHYGDFCRRFGFTALFIERKQSVAETYAASCAWESGCPLCIFDVESQGNVSVLMETQDVRGLSKLEEASLPPGRHAGVIYVPEYLGRGQNVRISISGAALVHEVVVGTLP